MKSGAYQGPQLVKLLSVFKFLGLKVKPRFGDDAIIYFEWQFDL